MIAVRLPTLLRLALMVALTGLLVAFHAFVGWHKAFSSHDVLRLHTAWTVHLPDWLGRIVGIVEMGLAVALLIALLRPRLGQLGVLSCYAFVGLEVISTLVHQITRDGASLPQNIISIVLTLSLAWLFA